MTKRLRAAIGVLDFDIWTSFDIRISAFGISLAGLIVALVAAPCTAQQAPPEIAARVNGEPIYAADVDRLVRESLKDREIAPEARAALAKEVLEQLISRRLILGCLTREGVGAAAEEVERAVKSLESRALQDKQPFDQWLKEHRFTLETLRDEVAWRIAWRRYLAEHVTEAALEQHFQKHRWHFDGSQVRVSHILWKLGDSQDAAAAKAASANARQVREQIVAGRLSFAQAAQKHSTAPSRGEGGDIGFIPRHGVMDVAFSNAAFELEKGQISQPVVTPFGVHLIQCLEIRPGEKAASDCRDELRLAISQELFQRLAAEQRRAAKVEMLPMRDGDKE
jgi:parvulin-like peptidyl-prolyl isomerase